MFVIIGALFSISIFMPPGSGEFLYFSFRTSSRTSSLMFFSIVSSADYPAFGLDSSTELIEVGLRYWRGGGKFILVDCVLYHFFTALY